MYTVNGGRIQVECRQYVLIDRPYTHYHAQQYPPFKINHDTTDTTILHAVITHTRSSILKCSVIMQVHEVTAKPHPPTKTAKRNTGATMLVATSCHVTISSNDTIHHHRPSQ
jgi:hypothetical protein